MRRATAQTAAESAAVAAFLSTLSLRRATFGHAVKIFVPEHFYPRSPCGERHAIVHVQCRGHGISIHALLAESDLDDCVALIPHQHFYPRSPCGERPMSCWNNLQVTIFLSTLSLRRATAPLDFFAQSNIIFLSTLSLRRATAGCMNINPPSIVISIHALLAESDRNVHRDSAASRPKFLSTLSLRRATPCYGVIPEGIGVFLSTLSLRRATPFILQ